MITRKYFSKIFLVGVGVGWGGWRGQPLVPPFPTPMAGPQASHQLNPALIFYIVSWGRIKLAISPKRLKIERKLLLTAYIKSYTAFRLPPKYMTSNDVWAGFKVIDSLSATKMTKYSLVMTPTPCRVDGCIIYLLGLRIHALALIYLLTYLHSWLCAYKTGNISETVEDRAKVTINRRE